MGLLYLISYHIIYISYHISYHHIISYHISYHILSYRIISYHHIISYHIISYILSYLIVSYHIISYHIISYYIILYCIIMLMQYSPDVITTGYLEQSFFFLINFFTTVASPLVPFSVTATNYEVCPSFTLQKVIRYESN